jgi:hypothetical protein
MSWKVVPPVAAAPVKRAVLELELEADSALFVTLRVKPDRRHYPSDVPVVFERRVTWLACGVKEPPSS